MYAWIEPKLTGSLEIDTESTIAARTEAREKTPQQFVRYAAGDALVHPGEPTDEEEMALLRHEHDEFVRRQDATHRAGRALAMLGLFAAMFGIGGGVVIVPLLMLVTRMPPRIAAATSLATLVLTSMIGTARYAGSGHIDWVGAAVIGVPAVAGVLLGVALQKRLPADWLIIAFGVLKIGRAHV